MSHTGIIIGGFFIVIIGVVLVATSGVAFDKLPPMLDFTAKLGDAEFTATDISPEAQTQMMSGAVVSIIGIIIIGVGAAK